MHAMVPVMMAASTVFSAYGQHEQGKAEERAASYQAKILKRNAGQRIAQSQQEAFEVERQGRLQQSRALAVAASSGGGASDVSVVKHMANLAGENHYRKTVALYEGQRDASDMTMQANLTRWGGKMAKRAGNIGAVSTVMRGAGSMLTKYGWGKP